MADLKTKIRVSVGLGISAACLVFFFREVDFNQLWQLTLGVNPLYAAGLCFLFAVSLWFRSLRWRILMEPVKPCGLGILYSANLIGIAANNILPVRMGELVRAYALGRMAETPASGVLATLVLERVLDGLNLLLILFGALLFIDPGAEAGSFSVEYLRGAGIFLLALYLGVTAVMVCLWLWPRQTIFQIGRLASKVSPKIGEKVSGLLETFHQGLSVLGSLGRLLPLALTTLGVWLPMLAMFTLFLPAMGLPLSLLMGAMALAGGSLGAAVPAGPGFVGTFQLAVTWCLMMVGADPQKAMAYSLVFWAVTNIPITAAGLTEMWRRGLGGKLF